MSDRPDDDLDRLIDALNAGNLDPAAVTDPELAGLLSVATEVRRGGEPEWPDADFPVRLARGVTAALRSSTAPAPQITAGDAGSGHRDDEPAPDGEPPARGVALAPGRHWAREAGQLAAAVLVLVVVGGLLTAVLRGHGSRSGVAPGSGAPELPITVTANSIPVTLEEVVATSTSTRFSLSVQLPPYAARQAAEPVIPPAAADVRVTGLVDAAPRPEFAQGPHQPGQATVDLSLTFASPVQPNQTVTLSLRQLGFAGIPSGTLLPPGVQPRPGPWTFTVPPALLTEQRQPLPTPNPSGIYTGLTFGQAQRLAPFHLVRPQWLPSYLHAGGITASVPNITEVRLTTPAAEATPPAGPVQVVSLTFGGPDPNEFAVVINELRQGTPLGPPWAPGSGPAPAGFGTTTTLTIAGHPVTRTTWAVTANYPVGGPNASYVWTAQGTTFQFLALIEDPVKQQDVEHMIASMLQPAPIPATPRAEVSSPTPAVPTPDAWGTYIDLTFGQAQQLAPFHLALPTWVPPYLQDAGIIASVLNDTEVQPFNPAATATPPTGPVQAVSVNFSGPASAQRATVTVDELKQGTPLGPVGGPGLPPSKTTTLTIAGHPVTRTTWQGATPVPTAPVDGPNASYVWTEQGTTFQLTALLRGGVTEQDLQHMIASMLP